jgi:hypothetical protein
MTPNMLRSLAKLYQCGGQMAAGEWHNEINHKTNSSLHKRRLIQTKWRKGKETVSLARQGLVTIEAVRIAIKDRAVGEIFV